MPYTPRAIADRATLLEGLAAHLATGAIECIETHRGATTIGPYQAATGDPAFAHFDAWGNRTDCASAADLARHALTVYARETIHCLIRRVAMLKVAAASLDPLTRTTEERPA